MNAGAISGPLERARIISLMGLPPRTARRVLASLLCFGLQRSGRRASPRTGTLAAVGRSPRWVLAASGWSSEARQQLIRSSEPERLADTIERQLERGGVERATPPYLLVRGRAGSLLVNARHSAQTERLYLELQECAHHR